MRFKAQNKMEIIDNDTDEVVNLLSCPCGNKVFYFTSDNEKICSCCRMTESEAETAQQEQP